MNRFLTRALITTGCLLAVAACGDDNTTTANTNSNSTPDNSTPGNSTPDSSTPDTTAPQAAEVLRYETNGGCLMMGPNCPTYVVYADGTIEIYRTGENAPAEVVGSIPEAEVNAFLDSVRDTDFEALAAEVGPGTCNSCVDGVDIKLTLTLADGPVELDSTVINFELSNAFFANVETLIEDVRAVGELPIQQRG